jgi:hypothetical protein
MLYYINVIYHRIAKKGMPPMSGMSMYRNNKLLAAIRLIKRYDSRYAIYSLPPIQVIHCSTLTTHDSQNNSRVRDF